MEGEDKNGPMGVRERRVTINGSNPDFLIGKSAIFVNLKSIPFLGNLANRGECSTWSYQVILELSMRVNSQLEAIGVLRLIEQNLLPIFQSESWISPNKCILCKCRYLLVIHLNCFGIQQLLHIKNLKKNYFIVLQEKSHT